MYFALVYYPHIELQGFQELRHKYEPYASLLPEHLTFLFPVPESIGLENIKTHIDKVLEKWKPFKVHFKGLNKTWDHWLFLGLKEGNDIAIKLHDDLYTGHLSPHLREDLPYTPHIGLGLCSKEDYDLNNPTAQLSLDADKYRDVEAAFKKLNLDFWRTIDHLTLVKVNEDFSKSEDIMTFNLND
jgi:2'-5' RNA ligase